MVLPEVIRRLRRAVPQWVVARRRGSAIWVLAVVVVLFAVVFLYLRPMSRVSKAGLAPEGRLKAENDIRTTLVQAVGGAIVLVGTWRTLHTNREGQITERFTRAIEHLGHTDENLDIRLGGIYALERIGRDSRSDRGPIIEVLTAFLREHARWDAEHAGSPSVTPGAASGSENGEPPRLRSDFQAAATVLARNGWAQQHRFELHEVDLRNAKLYKAHLQGAVFIKAHLEGANLIGADLHEALFLDAHLKSALLHRARLDRAILTHAQLQRANFFEAHLEGAIFSDAHLEGANLRHARLAGANFFGAQLRNADFTGAHLRNADFTGAHLWGVIGLEDAHLEGVVGLRYEPAQTENRPATDQDPD